MISVLREHYDAPDCVARELALAGGYNRFGEANYRAVWGWSRLGWIGGKWEDRDSTGALVREVVELRREPKYTPHNRWHIERWMPPESYGSPDQWHAQTLEIENGRNIPALGPYPSRGDYEHCFTLEGAARRVCAADSGGGTAHCARDRSEPRRWACEGQSGAGGSHAAGRAGV
jgi:hypothetical protein